MNITKLQTGTGLALSSETALAIPSWYLSMQQPQQREKIAHLLRLFSSARKHPGLTSDEVLVFFAIGYLSLSMSKNVILMRSVRFVDVASALGIPKETVRRKTMRLVDIDYVSASRNGIAIKQFDVWFRMFERAII
jgi:hypothetical protein